MQSPSDTTRRAGTDLCPGALAVHRAADGGLARVRLPGGALPVRALAALGAAAVELGNGVLELTSRANVQVRGLRPGVEVELADRLRGVGLLPSETHERVRNIVATPLTGRHRNGHLDVRGLVRELDKHLCADPDLAALPGRFLFTVDDGAADVSALEGDVGLLALGAEEFALLLGGADSGLRVPPIGTVAAALAAARGFLAERAAQGSSAWRLAELTDGPARVAARVKAAVPEAAEGAEPPARLLAVARPVKLGVIAQADGRAAVATLVPGGTLSPDAVAALVAGAGPKGVLRVTPWRSIVLTDLDPAQAARAVAGLAGAGLLIHPHTPWAGVTTCTGRPGCAEALADVRADAARFPEAVRPAGRGCADEHAEAAPLPLHWAGCERRCGHPAGRYVEVLATPGGYEVSRDGMPWGPPTTAESAHLLSAAARRA